MSRIGEDFSDETFTNESNLGVTNPLSVFTQFGTGSAVMDIATLQSLAASTQRTSSDMLPSSYTTLSSPQATGPSPVYRNEFTKRQNWSYQIVDELKDMFHVVSPAGKIIFCSPASSDIIGYTPDELVGRNITEFIHVDDIDTYVREFNMSVVQRHFRLFVRLRRKDEQFILVEVVGHSMFATAAVVGSNGFTNVPLSNPTDLGTAGQSGAMVNIDNLLTFPPQPVVFDAQGLYPSSSRNAGSNAKNVPFQHSMGSATGADSFQTSSCGDPNGDNAAGSSVVKYFFSIARPYPTAPTNLLDSILELKVENEMLMRRYQQLEGDPDTLHRIIATLDDKQELTQLVQPPRYPLDEMLRSPSFPTSAYSPTTAHLSTSSLHGITETPHLAPLTGKRKKRRTKVGQVELVCTDCGTVESPEWRRGPQGPKTLCNAC
ncbi:hypothetical protein IWQ61_010105, partial [Dispira simplex]